MMRLYEYHCETCNQDFDIRRGIHEIALPIDCSTCGNVLRRVYSTVAFAMPGKKASDSFNDWYDGKEVGPGMTREKTMRLARKLHRDQKAMDVQLPKRTVSTPTHPAARADDRTD